MNERQAHGFKFEKKYIAENNLTAYEKYTSPFDAYDEKGIDYQIKTIKKGSSIDLGDIFRNANKEKDFYLIVSFWQGEKENIVEINKLYIDHVIWNEYLKFDMYDELKDWIKNKVSNSYDYDLQWRKEVKNWKSLFGKRLIMPRFKRDHKKQRRIQCGITNRVFYSHFVKNFSV